MITLALKAIGKFFAVIPWKIWLVIAILVAVAIGGRVAYNNGKAEVQAKWDASVERGRAIVEDLKKQRGTVTTVTEIKYVEREKVIREKGKTITELREVFVPVDSGYLSGGFRLFYDAAITNTVPLPASIATAAPIAIEDVADTHAYNAEQCNVAYEKVAKWNEWADEQCKLNPNGCP